MKNSVEILDAVAAKLGGVSDYRIWKDVGIYHGTISSVRAGRCALSPANLAKAAEVLEVEVGALIAIVAAEREEDPDIRDSLLRVAERGMKIAAQAGKGARRRAAAAVVLAAGVLAGAPGPVQAAIPTAEAKGLFIMSTQHRRRRTRRRAPDQVYPKRTKRILYMALGGKVSSNSRLIRQQNTDCLADTLRAA